MPHISTNGRKPRAVASLIALVATLVAVSLGLAACGGSASTTTQTTANAAATGATTTGASTPSTTTPGATSPGTSSTGTAPTGRPNPARFTAVRECLSKKGITLPQRTSGAGGLLGGGGGGGAQLPKGMTRAQFAEALKSCGSGFAGGRNRFRGGGKGFRNPFNSPRFHQVLARFSACLRQHGVNVGEPNTTGKGPIFDTKGLNTGSPQFKTATAACRSTLLGALRPKASPGTAGSTTTNSSS